MAPTWRTSPPVRRARAPWQVPLAGLRDAPILLIGTEVLPQETSDA